MFFVLTMKETIRTCLEEFIIKSFVELVKAYLFNKTAVEEKK